MMAPRIVLLSNDDAPLSAMHALLTGKGYRILRCRPRDVTNAHAVVKRAQADLVIVDLWLAKREDGWTFLRRMCADLETMHIPAIIASGQPEIPPGSAELLRTMACHVMIKPFDSQELLRAIAATLDPSPMRPHGGDPVHATSHVDFLAAAAEEAL